MNKTRIVFGIGIVLAALALFTAPAMGYGWEAHFVPENSTGGYGEPDVLVYINFTESVGETVSGQTDIYYDKNCLNIVTIDQSMSPFSWNDYNWFNASYHGSFFMPELSPTQTCFHVQYDNPAGGIPAGDYTLAVLTLHGNNTGSSDLLHGYTEVNNEMGDPITGGFKYYNGTYTCAAPEETFSKPLAAGYNLISLPLTPSDNSTAKVLETVPNDAVFRYNANVKAWEGVATMDPGIGYFVNVTAPGQTNWTYNGTAYTSMNVSIEKGLNMVGWLNCSMNVTGSDDALSSLEGKYNYAARFNATSQRFEAYEPHAPPAFNDFTTMDRGTGYFISARAGCPRLVKDCTA